MSMEDTNLKDENISLGDITLKTFMPLIAKRFVFFILKSVGSRSMIWSMVEYLTSLFVMYLFASQDLPEKAMLFIFRTYIAQGIFVLTLFGILKFNNINTDIKLGK